MALIFLILCILHTDTVPVRLVNGNGNSSGRVEVHFNSEWGTACDDGWDLNAATVVCKQLGFDGAVSVRPKAYFGEGSAVIGLDETHCTGKELNILNCNHSAWKYHNCLHSEDVGVECGG